MTDYASSDYAAALEALLVTLGNLKVDQPDLFTADEWDEILSIVGEDMYSMGRKGYVPALRSLLGMVTSMFVFEDTPTSLIERFTEVSRELSRL